MRSTLLRPALVRPRPARRTAALASAALLALSLSACGSGDDAAAAAADDSGDGTALTITDPWVKSADSGMTAAFGTLVNDGDEDVTVTGVTTDLSPTTELHETVSSDGAMQMQEVDGGFTVPAGGELELTPGGNHLMLMDLQRAVRPGEEVSFVLQLEGGDELGFDAVAKETAGGEEEYVPGDGEMDMGDDS